MNNTIKIINIFGLIFSILCMITSFSENDWSELIAWFIVTMYYVRDIFLLKW
jgi:c-di-AMP phosphodiesterase-like protein